MGGTVLYVASDYSSICFKEGTPITDLATILQATLTTVLYNVLRILVPFPTGVVRDLVNNLLTNTPADGIITLADIFTMISQGSGR